MSLTLLPPSLCAVRVNTVHDDELRTTQETHSRTDEMMVTSSSLSVSSPNSAWLCVIRQSRSATRLKSSLDARLCSPTNVLSSAFLYVTPCSSPRRRSSSLAMG